jgi:L-ascorbate metabolism protein UlaG (beta-lactamase superfamily)
MTAYRLADGIVIEPLMLRWHAWWCNVAPLPASFHAAQYQIPTMKNYLRFPKVHVDASRDPQLIGAAFINVAEERAGDIAKLLSLTEREMAPNVAFAAAAADLQSRILSEAQGQSLNTYYAELAEPLRGLVELVYDYGNRPSVRFVEGALYKSPYHRPDLQSVRIFRPSHDQARPYFMSTPRLEDGDAVEWSVPFADPRLDELCALDVQPRELSALRDRLGPEVVGGDGAASFLTEAAPPKVERWTAAATRVRYVGHACVLVEHGDLSILLDPLVPPQGPGATRVSFADLPARIDYALVTHAHFDHFNVETLLRLRHRIECLVVPRNHGLLWGDISLKQLARNLGFRRILDVDTYDSIPLPDGEILAAPFMGEHGDLAHGKTTYLVRFGAQTLLFAADATCLDPTPYRRLRQDFGPLDAVFMNTETEGAPPTYCLEPLFPKNRNRKLEKTRLCRGSNASEGLALLEAVGARRLFNYAMGLEPWTEYLLGPAAGPDTPRMRESDRLLQEARSRGLEAERLVGPRDIVLERT